MIKYCEWCGAEFEGNGSQKYCSYNCLAEVELDRKRKKMKPNPERVCPVCGKEFIPSKNQKYCSRECSDSVCSGTRFSVNSSFLLLDRMLESLTEEDAKTAEDWILRNTNDKTVKLHLRGKVKS